LYKSTDFSISFAPMSILKKIRNILSDPRLEGVDVDSPELLVVHRKIMMEKRIMREVFTGFYNTCMAYDQKYFTAEGQRIEIGAGVSFFKEVYPEIIATDIKPADNLDRVLDALNMDIDDNSVRAFYGLNCFHHFPSPDRFFKELERTLVPGGGCVLIEPYFGPVAAKMYKSLFDTETFDPNQKDWESDSSVMYGANQALSYIVFVRDRKLFEEHYPDLEIVKIKPLPNYLRYLLSGGLNFRSLVPGFMSPVIQFMEWLISPLNRVLALHYSIVIRKKESV